MITTKTCILVQNRTGDLDCIRVLLYQLSYENNCWLKATSLLFVPLRLVLWHIALNYFFRSGLSRIRTESLLIDSEECKPYTLIDHYVLPTRIELASTLRKSVVLAVRRQEQNWAIREFWNLSLELGKFTLFLWAIIAFDKPCSYRGTWGFSLLYLRLRHIICKGRVYLYLKPDSCWAQWEFWNLDLKFGKLLLCLWANHAISPFISVFFPIYTSWDIWRKLSSFSFFSYFISTFFICCFCSYHFPWFKYYFITKRFAPSFCSRY